jgi:hypothetical protein
MVDRSAVGNVSAVDAPSNSKEFSPKIVQDVRDFAIPSNNALRIESGRVHL